MTIGKFQTAKIQALPTKLESEKNTHILIADDHDLLREVLSAYIEDLWPDTKVTQAGGLAEALNYIMPNGYHQPDIMILDLEMPGMQSFVGLETIRLRLPKTPIVILSDKSENQQIVESFRYGADGFIPKTMKPAAMICALQLVLAGEKYLPSTLLKESGLRAETQTANDSQIAQDTAGQPLLNQGLQKLTQREYSVLSLLAEGASNKEIARNLNIQEITVKSHMKSIFRKLNTKNRTQAAKIALEAGLASS